MQSLKIELRNNRFITNVIVFDVKNNDEPDILNYLKTLDFHGDDRSRAHALIDTGANISGITEELSEKLNLISKGKGYVTGVSGVRLSNYYSIWICVPRGSNIKGDLKMEYS